MSDNLARYAKVKKGSRTPLYVFVMCRIERPYDWWITANTKRLDNHVNMDYHLTRSGMPRPNESQRTDWSRTAHCQDSA